MMSSKNWLLLGSVALGAAQAAACSAEFRTCETTRTCHGGASGMAGAAGDGEAGADEGGRGGRDAQSDAGSAGEGGSGGHDAEGGEPGHVDDAGSGGVAGESSVDTELEIATPNLDAGKTYVPFSGKVSASGAAHYSWSITSGSLPAGLALQGAQSATVTIAGTPTEAGQFPVSLSVTDGSTTKAVDVTLAITHPALFLSDRRIAGVNELFLAEIGGDSPSAPVQLSATLPSGGGVSSYAWSPDGSKVLYLAKQFSSAATELWVASLAAAGTAQRVSAPGVSVNLMTWLKSGSIGAYVTSTGDAYLVDLSGSTPGSSKLALSGPANPLELAASPNGTSLTIGTSDNTKGTVTYVTWTAGTPQAVKVYALPYSDSSLSFSFDGRFGLSTITGTKNCWDLSSASPTAMAVPSGGSNDFAWSPNTRTLLFRGSDNASIATFESGSTSVTALVQRGCSVYPGSWSSDGKNVVVGCQAFGTPYDANLRGISNVSPAAAGTDFSLLPSGFSSEFTNLPAAGWSPDSKWIAFLADRDVDAQYDFHLVRWSAPGVPYRPYANSTSSAVTWAFAQSSQSVAFVGTIAPQNNAGLYLSNLPASGAPSTAALISAPASAVVQTDIKWLPGSRVITYRAAVSGAAQLFAVPVAADGNAGSPVPISGVSGGGVSSYQLAPAR